MIKLRIPTLRRFLLGLLVAPAFAASGMAFTDADTSSSTREATTGMAERALASAQTGPAETTTPKPGKVDRGAEADPGDRTYVYKTVNDQALRLWVRMPAESAPGDRRPAVVFFHGGGWVGGPLFQFSPQSTHFVSRGMVAVQVEYRFAPRSENGGPPLICIQDAKSAMRWVRSHAIELGIDPERIAVGGGSAGGHLAAACSMLEGCDDPQDDLSVSAKGNAQLLFNPVSDVGPEGGYAHPRIGENWRDYSPAHHVTSETPPTIVFLGTKDQHIPVKTIERLAADMQRAGVRCDTHYYEGRAHGFFNRGDDLADTVKKCDDFLVSLGWLKPVP